MNQPSKSRVRTSIETAIAALPWLASMYFFYWLDSSGNWTSETPHRGKLSVLILGSGMLVSFLVWSWFRQKRS